MVKQFSFTPGICFLGLKYRAVEIIVSFLNPILGWLTINWQDIFNWIPTASYPRMKFDSSTWCLLIPDPPDHAWDGTLWIAFTLPPFPTPTWLECHHVTLAFPSRHPTIPSSRGVEGGLHQRLHRSAWLPNLPDEDGVQGQVIPSQRRQRHWL